MENGSEPFLNRFFDKDNVKFWNDVKTGRLQGVENQQLLTGFYNWYVRS
jgi:hypothetical protein